MDTVRTDTLRTDSLTAPLDSAARDSLRADSLRAEAIRRRAERAADTIKAPLVRYPVPPGTEALRERRWTRDELLATGAINVAELLDDVPGVTTFRTSWFPGVHAAAFQGDFRRLRVFLDGLELDAPDPRNDGVLDLVEIPLTSLDEVVVERSAGEVRVWLRTWTVTSVTPYSRTDVFTGDLNTNGFRGLFGRRFMNGALFQLTMQQGETSQQRGNVGFGGAAARGETGDGDLRQITARLGWARGLVSVDGYLSSSSRSRDITAAEDAAFAIPIYDGSRRDAYLRLGYGDPSRGLQAQLMLGHLRTGLDEPDDATTGTTDSLAAVSDSARSIAQRLVQVGYGFERSRVELFTRWRGISRDCRTETARSLARASLALVPCDAGDPANDVSPGARLTHDRGWLRGSVYAERVGLDSSRRVDGNLRLQLRSWFATSLALSSLDPDAETGRSSERTARAEGALALGARRVSGGVIRQSVTSGTRTVVIPRLITPYESREATELAGFTSNAFTVGVASPLYKDLRLELRRHAVERGARVSADGRHLRAALHPAERVAQPLPARRLQHQCAPDPRVPR